MDTFLHLYKIGSRRFIVHAKKFTMGHNNYNYIRCFVVKKIYITIKNNSSTDPNNA